MASSKRDAETRADPLEDYLRALACYDDSLLTHILAGMVRKRRSGNLTSRELVHAIAEHTGDPQFLAERLPRLSTDMRLALGFFSIQETCSIRLAALAHALQCLRIAPFSVIGNLLRDGLVAAWRKEEGSFFWVYSFRFLLEDLMDGGEGPPGIGLFIHPAVRAACRAVCPCPNRELLAGPVRHERQPDGLESTLRLAALWQRVAEAPLRLTQQATLYKRDRDRLADDPALAGAIADAVSPLGPMVDLWLELGCALGLLISEPAAEELHAAPVEFWAAKAPDLPELAARRWLTLSTWHEEEGFLEKHDEFPPALPYTRTILLLLLAAAPADQWVRLDALCKYLDRASSSWRRTRFLPGQPAIPRRPPEAGPGGTDGGAARPPCDLALLEAMLLGAAYPLGLVRAAEEVSSGQRAVQLTPLGRHILGMGPAPEPRATVEQFLYVQPNFEVVAYRQGLSPAQVGQLCRFARITQVGAALELKLTPESIYHGLESGLAPEEMLEQLTRHSARPLPLGVAEAVRTWSGRRDRLTYYSAATVIEFATAHDLELALADWPATGAFAPARITDRLLLVEDETAIPFHRFRQAGARDYKRPAEVCIEIEPDGITLRLDLAHSDLLVDAELGRFADERHSRDAAPNARARRQFAITQESLARAVASGFSAAQLAEWFEKRTGQGLPPAVSLLLHAQKTDPAAFRAAQPLVLFAPSKELLDGLAQHPATRDLLGERIGPTGVVISDKALAQVQAALAALGLTVDVSTIEAARNVRTKR